MKKTLLFVAILSLSILANAQISPLEIAKTKHVSDIEISQDGKYIAYSVMIPSDGVKKNSPAKYKLYLLDTETEKTLPFAVLGSVHDFKFRPKH